MKCSDEVIRRGLLLLDKENYREAFDALLPCAESEHIDSMAAVGLMYQLGLGVQRNIEKAIFYLQKAAEKGNGPAAHNLGTLYLTCEPDMKSDSVKSKYWYERARTLGFIVGS